VLYVQKALREKEPRIPEQLFGEASSCAGLFRDGVLVGACELSHVGGVLQVKHFVVDRTRASSAEELRFLGSSAATLQGPTTNDSDCLQCPEGLARALTGVGIQQMAQDRRGTSFLVSDVIGRFGAFP
jgi:hypothetical protein